MANSYFDALRKMDFDSIEEKNGVSGTIINIDESL